MLQELHMSLDPYWCCHWQGQESLPSIGPTVETNYCYISVSNCASREMIEIIQNNENHRQANTYMSS